MRNNIIRPLLLVGACFYYFSQVCPTFYFWDSAELTAAVLSKGVPHPPGFPFLLMLAKIWSWLVPGDRSYALNLLSAAAAAVGLVLWHAVLRDILSRSRLANDDRVADFIALVGVVVLGISLSYSAQATRLEVYSLNFVGFSLMLMTSLAITRHTASRKWMVASLFALIGLWLGMHILTIALLVPGLMLIILLDRRGEESLCKRLLQLLMGIVLAVSLAFALYLSIYFLAKGNPMLNWGDPSTPERFRNYILLKGFSTSIAHFTPAHLWENLKFVAVVLSGQVGAVGLLLSILALFSLAGRKPQLGIPLLLILVLNALSTVFASDYFYENYDLHGYLLISLGVVSVGLALAFLHLFRFFSGGLKANTGTGKTRARALILTSVVAGLVVLPPVSGNIFSANLSSVTSAGDLAAEFLKDAPEDALVITSSYNTYFCLMAYLSANPVERDLTVLNIYDWDHRWGRRQACQRLAAELPLDVDRQTFYRKLLNHFMNDRPIYVEYDQSSRPVARYLKPEGLGYLFATNDTATYGMEFARKDISEHLGKAKGLRDIETVRTWVWWLSNRAGYFGRRGYGEIAGKYLEALEGLAATADLN